MRNTDISVLNVGINYLEEQRDAINARSQLISIDLAEEATDYHTQEPCHTSTYQNKSKKKPHISP